MKYKKIKFPLDEGSHDTVGEWWYFNGNLTGDDGRKYSYMNTLFRLKLSLNNKLLKKLDGKNWFVYHSIITDIEKNKFYPTVDFLVKPSSDSFKHEGLNVYFMPRKNRHYYMEQPEDNKYRIKGENISLEMVSKKQPLLEGGTGYVSFFNRPTYYYSLTDLETTGHIVVDGKKVRVSGKSWMDHQWSDTYNITQDYWNWFSVQLRSGEEIVCYEYGHKNKNAYLATVIDKDGKQTSFDKLEIKPLGQQWQSPKTKAIYDTSWNVKIPEADINLIIKAEVTDHEMNFLNVNYWESPIRIVGTIRNKKVEGCGYMELAGRPSIFNDTRYLKEKVLNRIRTKNRV